MNHLQHYQGNPSTGMATFGAVLGGAIGSTVVSLGAILLTAAVHRLRTGEEGTVRMEAHRLYHLLVGAGAMLGSGYGAALGAAPHQRSAAMTGALLGSGLVAVGTTAANPKVHGAIVYGFLGSAAAGVGTAVGAATAR